MKYLFLMIIFFLLEGCSNLQQTDARPPEVVLDYDAPCSSEQWKGKQCFSMKEKYFSQECSWGRGDIEACYKYGFLREQRGDDTTLILQVYQKACDRGESKSCESIKRVLTNQCVSNRLHPNKDLDCYTLSEGDDRGYGVTIRKQVRKDTPMCNKKLEEAKKALGCSRVGDYEAKQARFTEAEKIYKDGCTSSNNEGCAGLVCLGYMNMNKGKKETAWNLFKQACRNSEIKNKNPSPYDFGKSYDAKSFEGCTVVQANNTYLSSLIRDMPQMEESCKTGWSRSWGPLK